MAFISKMSPSPLLWSSLSPYPHLLLYPSFAPSSCLCYGGCLRLHRLLCPPTMTPYCPFSLSLSLSYQKRPRRSHNSLAALWTTENRGRLDDDEQKQPTAMRTRGSEDRQREEENGERRNRSVREEERRGGERKDGSSHKFCHFRRCRCGYTRRRPVLERLPYSLLSTHSTGRRRISEQKRLRQWRCGKSSASHDAINGHLLEDLR